MIRRRDCLHGLAFLLGTAPAATAWAQEPPKGTKTFAMRGSIGPYPIGASVTVRDHTDFVAAHYFYASRLIDIPLTGRSKGEFLTLWEPEGGIFSLQLFGNGTEKDQPLTFYNSVGLRGSWTHDDKVLPVVLRFNTVYDRAPGEDRYAEVTQEPRTAFEARVNRFLRAVLDGDRRAAASAVSYPLRVNADGRTIVIRNRTELLARWNEVFTPKLLAALRTTIPHEMFVRQEMAMLGDGLVWFDATGAAVINRP